MNGSQTAHHLAPLHQYPFVMKNTTFCLLLATCLLVLMVSSCQKDNLTDPFINPDLPFLANPNDTLDPTDPIDQQIIGIIDSTFQFGPVIAQPGILEDPLLLDEETTTQDGIRCEVKQYKWAPGYGEPMLFDLTAGMWVGELYRAESIVTGSYTQIPAHRKPIILSTSLPNINGSPSDTMFNPSLSAYRESINKMFNQGVNGATPAQVSFSIQEVRSSEEFKLTIGANYGNFWGNIKASFDWNTAVQKSRHSVTFQQIYYSVDMDLPNSPSEFFLTPPDLNQFGEYSPVYVSSIKYGRMALFTFESDSSSSEVNAALNATFSFFGGDGGVDITAHQKATLNASSIKAYIVGGSGAYAVQAIQGFEGLKQWILEGGNYSSDSPGVPMAYQLRFLKDNSLAKIVLASEYNVRTCEVVAEEYAFTPATPQGGHYLCAGHVGGDGEFNGHGPYVNGKVTLRNEGNEIWADVDFAWTETVPDSTKGVVQTSIHLHTIPSDKAFVGFITEKEVYASYIDDDHDADEPPITGSDYIEKMVLIGDTEDGDLECNGDLDSNVRIFFNKPIKLSVKQL